MASALIQLTVLHRAIGLSPIGAWRRAKRGVYDQIIFDDKGRACVSRSAVENAIGRLISDDEIAAWAEEIKNTRAAYFRQRRAKLAPQTININVTKTIVHKGRDREAEFRKFTAYAQRKG
jgi:hypothetical protein